MKYITAATMAIVGLLLITAPFIYCAITSALLSTITDEVITYISVLAGVGSLFFSYNVAMKTASESSKT